MSDPNRPVAHSVLPSHGGDHAPNVLLLLEQRLAKYRTSGIERPRLSREEVCLMAAGGNTAEPVRAYLGHRFDGANAQLVAQARSEQEAANDRHERTRAEAVQIEQTMGGRDKYTIVRQPNPVQPRTALEGMFSHVVIAAALLSLGVAWNALTANMLNSGLFPGLMEFPQSLSLFLMAFAAVALAFLPKIYLDQLDDRRRRQSFLAMLESATALIGLVWLVCVSILFSPSVSGGFASVGVDVSDHAGEALIGSVLLFSQLLAEIGMGSLLWIFALRLNERGRLEVACEVPAYTRLAAESDMLFIRQSAIEEYRGALRGFLTAVEDIRAQFVSEELNRIEVERFRQEGIKRLAVIRELESMQGHADGGLHLVS